METATRQIDAGIPLAGWKRYPFGQMSKGDSFVLLPTDNLACVRSAACWYGKRNSMKFAVRCDDPVKKTSYRCWRTA